MTPSLARHEFHDRLWEPADLDAAAEFWLRLYESAAGAMRLNPSPQHQTEIRLRGLPRAEVEPLAESLSARAPATDFGRPHVAAIDPDTLSLSTTLFPGGEAPPMGLGLPLLATEAFDGLAAEIRFTVSEPRRRSSSTLVLAGELRAGAFLLKSARRVGHSKWDDELATHAPWLNEAEFFAALEEFRSSGDVPAKLAKRLFPPRSADRLAALTVSTILVPFDRPRLLGLLLRLFCFSALVVASAAWCYWLWAHDELLVLIPFVLLTFIFIWFAATFLRLERRIWSVGYAQYRALHATLEAEGLKLLPLSREESARAAADPYVRKYTADLTAAGFTLLGDARVFPPGVGEIFYRVFAAPDGTTYLAAAHQSSNPFTDQPGKVQHFWPADVWFVCHTFLTSGGYAASLNGSRDGYRRKLTGPECLSRVFPRMDDPVAFAQLHGEVAAKFAAETGNPPLRHVRFEDYVRRRSSMVEEERRLYADSPYTLGDHLHWYLQIPRRAYRG